MKWLYRNFFGIFFPLIIFLIIISLTLMYYIKSQTIPIIDNSTDPNPPIFFLNKSNLISRNTKKYKYLLNYSTNWINTVLITPFINMTLNVSSCPICKFDPTRIRPNSLKNDIILTSFFGDFKNVIIFARSLRTTGCQATIIFLTDDETLNQLSFFEKDLLNSCGCYIVNIGFKPVMTWKSFIYWRNSLYHDFLLNRYHLINRIVICDVSNTIFQGDPFDEEFQGQILIIGIEPNSISSYSNRINSFKLINKTLSNFVSNRHPINPNTFGGSSISVYYFLKYLIEIINQLNPIIGIIADESVFFSYAVYTNVLAKKSIKFIVDSRGKFFTDVLPKEKTDTVHKIGKYFHSLAGRPPFIITKFSNSEEFCKSIILLCQPKNIKIKKYINCNENFLRNYLI